MVDLVALKDLLPSLMNKIRGLATSTGQDMAEYEGIESKIINMVAPAMDEAVLLEAKHHSCRAYRQVKSGIAAKDKIGERMSPFLAGLGIETVTATCDPF